MPEPPGRAGADARLLFRLSVLQLGVQRGAHERDGGADLGLHGELVAEEHDARADDGDALTRASEENPDLIVDFATLTGAARVALGPDLPALFARRDETAEAFLAAGRANDDPAWRLPLHEAYREYLASDVADMANSGPGPFAGASVAGLFLDRFVGAKEDGTPIDWVHFDTFAWTPAPKPGRARGGRGLGLRASWHAIRARYAA